MSETKHTPGPWYAYSPLARGIHAGHHYKVANSKPEGICEDEDGAIVPHFPNWNASSRVVCTTTDDEHSRDNARLIAAAPDLLAALRPFAAGYTGPDAPCHDGLREPAECWRCSRILAARAAIAKAEGGEG